MANHPHECCVLYSVGDYPCKEAQKLARSKVIGTGDLHSKLGQLLPKPVTQESSHEDRIARIHVDHGDIALLCPRWLKR
jgi:hypothetical protein